MKLFTNFKNAQYRKTFIIVFLFSGVGFATIMAAFDYYGNKVFSKNQFLFNMLINGLIMGFILTSLKGINNIKK